MSLFPLIGEACSPELACVEPEGVAYAFGKIANSGITINDAKSCQLCKIGDWIYRCPGCDFKSCSLSCITQHKSRFNCNGKRKMTEFLTRKQITQEALTQDYNYLSEVTRVAENSERELKRLDTNMERSRSKKLHTLAKKMEKYQIELIITSIGLSRAQANKSHWNTEKKTGIWSIDFQINPVQTEPFKFTFHSINGEHSLAQIFQSRVLHRMPNDKRVAAKDSLRTFLFKNKDDSILQTSAASLHYLMPTLSSKPSKPTYYILNANLPFQEALRSTKFYEYPTISVYVEIPSNFSTLDAGAPASGSSSDETSESESSSSESSCQNSDEIDLADL
ncbi:Box C/D snoRNA protein 1 [Entomophthora muscae]|uniref:Box C/D snoRNA protein 1 n=1 Tax=Entomophthora muscae TaxID=34485 RepID=A0ACC2U9V0_9FUNG|nr:Box C/D snoRNA protein 1 [Entomophthora muscae]